MEKYNMKVYTLTVKQSKNITSKYMEQLKKQDAWLGLVGGRRQKLEERPSSIGWTTWFMWIWRNRWMSTIW